MLPGPAVYFTALSIRIFSKLLQRCLVARYEKVASCDHLRKLQGLGFNDGFPLGRDFPRGVSKVHRAHFHGVLA